LIRVISTIFLISFLLLGCVQQPEKEEDENTERNPSSSSSLSGITIDSSGLGDLTSKDLTTRTIRLYGGSKYKVVHLKSNSCASADFSAVAFQTSSYFSFTPHTNDVNIVCAVGVDETGVMSLVTSSSVLTIDTTLSSLVLNSSGLGASPSSSGLNRTVTYSGAVLYKVLHRVSNTCTGADLSGVAANAVTSFTFSPAINQDNIVCLIGIDADGVESQIVSSNVLTIDTIAPTMTVHSNGLGTSPSGNTGMRSIVATGADAYKYILKTGTDCSGVNFSPVSLSSGAFNFTPAPNASNIVCVKGFDAAGNESGVVASSVLYIDAIAPTVTLVSSHGASPSNNPTLRTINVSGANYYRYLALTALDCSGANFTTATRTISSSFQYTPVSNTNNIVCIQGEDNAGNYSTTLATTVLVIDTVAPNIPTFVLADPLTSPSTDDTPTLRVTNSKVGESVNIYSDSGCTTMLNGASFVSYPLDITLPSVSLGDNTFYAKAFDISGNSSACSTGLGYFREITFSDPLYPYAWHLFNKGQTNFSNQIGRTGEDLNPTNAWILGATGSGVKIAVSDQAIDVAHADLSGNMLLAQSMDYNVSDSVNNVPATPTGSEMHGTAVSGIIGAAANNGIGSIGVAYDSLISSLNFLSPGVTQNLAVLLNQASGDFDIFNYSYGSAYTCAYNATNSTYRSLLEANTGDTVTTPGALRAGKGAVYIKSAGNSFTDSYSVAACPFKATKQYNDGTDYHFLGNSNLGSGGHTPYILITGAYNALGVKASYSTIGSSLWASAPGGEFGLSSGYVFNQPFGLGANEFNMNGPAMMTTDLPGCTNGSAKTGGSVAYQFNLGDTSSDADVIGKNTNCDYTNTMNGTSSAAPSLSGVVALMLDINPALTWRDVRHIIAKTAIDPTKDATNTSFNSPPQSHPLRNTGVPSDITGRLFQRSWVTNAAGYMFHNWYGFGKVDAGAAVAMANTYSEDLKTFTSFNTGVQSVSTAIPDPIATNPVTANPISETVNVTRTNFFVENVELVLNITHPYVGDLGLEITSPSGTISQVLYINSGVSQINYTNAVLISNAFYGESPTGNWKIEIVDGATGDTGTLVDYQINFYGHDL